MTDGQKTSKKTKQNNIDNHLKYLSLLALQIK